MVTNPEKIQIKQLVQSPQWGAVEHLMQLKIQQWKDDTTLRDSEWETVKAACLQQGRIEGLNQLLQELYKIAQS